MSNYNNKYYIPDNLKLSFSKVQCFNSHVHQRTVLILTEEIENEKYLSCCNKIIT